MVQETFALYSYNITFQFIWEISLYNLFTKPSTKHRRYAWLVLCEHGGIVGLGCMNIMVTPCRKVAHVQESTRTSFFSYFTLLSLSFFLFISDTLVTDYLIAH